MTHDPTDATALAAQIRSGKLSATQALEQQFDRVDRHNPALNAIIWQNRAEALEHARQLDKDAAQGDFRGPLHGVPGTVKEAFDLAGSPSTWGNPAWVRNIPERDSLVVKRYRDAGGVIFGKTNVPLNLADWQSFNDIYGSTNNPWDLTRGPGGSSGGSAAALASGMSYFEAGSDIGSSIRNPAHYCGVYGLKPTWNIVPQQGHQPPGSLTDPDIAVTGPMARSARDLALCFDLLAGADDWMRDAWSTHCPPDPRRNLSDFRIAVKLDDPACPVDQSYQDALGAFAEKLAGAGARVQFDAEPDLNTTAHFDLYMTLLGAALCGGLTSEFIAEQRQYMEERVTGTVRHMWRLRFDGQDMHHADWQVLDNERRKARQVFDRFFGDWDILMVPVCASAAFEHNHKGQRYERELIINGKAQAEPQQLFWSGYSGVVGLPSAVGPAGQVGHLPVGYQAIAGHGRDRTALAFAQAVEREVIGFTPPPGYE